MSSHNMLKFKSLRPFLYSFYSKDLYVEVLGAWQGKGLRVLFMLAFLVSILVCSKVHFSLGRFVSETAPQLVEQMKPMEIEGGELRVKDDVPYTVTDPDTGKVVAIVDPTGKSLEGSSVPVRVSGNAITFKYADKPDITLNYQQMTTGSHEISQEWLLGGLNLIRKWTAVFIFPFVMIFQFGLFFLQALLFSVVTLLLSKLLGLYLGWEECLRLSIVALLPSVILRLILGSASVYFPPLCWLLVTLYYVYFGLKSFKEEVYE